MNELADDLRGLVADTAERVLRDHCDRSVMDAAEEGTWPAALWRTLEDAGLPTAAVPEELGGSGGGLGDAMAVLRQAGRYAAPVPLAETFLAGWVLAGSGLEVPAGPLTVAPVARGDALTARREGDGWVLSGAARRVPWAAQAARIVVLAEAGGATKVAVLEPAECDVRAGANLAAEPRDDVVLDGVAVGGNRLADAGPGVDAEALWRLGALARAVLMAGALERLLAMTVGYALERVQFGRPIGKFQAVQQQLAVLAGEAAAAGKAADEAVRAAEAGGGEIEIALAKARVGEAAGIGAEIAHQVHGAIGITHEHMLHHFTRRLWSWRDAFGAEVHWQAELGRRVAAGGADNLWGFLTGT